MAPAKLSGYPNYAMYQQRNNEAKQNPFRYSTTLTIWLEHRLYIRHLGHTDLSYNPESQSLVSKLRSTTLGPPTALLKYNSSPAPATHNTVVSIVASFAFIHLIVYPSLSPLTNSLCLFRLRRIRSAILPNPKVASARHLTAQKLKINYVAARLKIRRTTRHR